MTAHSDRESLTTKAIAHWSLYRGEPQSLIEEYKKELLKGRGLFTRLIHRLPNSILREAQSVKIELLQKPSVEEVKTYLDNLTNNEIEKAIYKVHKWRDSSHRRSINQKRIDLRYSGRGIAPKINKNQRKRFKKRG